MIPAFPGDTSLVPIAIAGTVAASLLAIASYGCIRQRARHKGSVPLTYAENEDEDFEDDLVDEEEDEEYDPE